MKKSSDGCSKGELLRGAPIAWPKCDEDTDIARHVRNTAARIVFEDDQVIAFEVDDDEREGPAASNERRITVTPKMQLESLLDIGVAEAQLSAHLLFALQEVAFKLKLYQTGFEVRCNVLPPYQRRPRFSLQIRTGRREKPRRLSS
jgi:hypothetical protein